MPGFDRSGPMGTGAMTGGRRGYCNTTDNTDAGAYAKRYSRGQGCGRGRFSAGGFGRGQGRGVYEPMRTTSPPDELGYLTQEAQNLEKNLQMIKKRIDNLQEKPE